MSKISKILAREILDSRGNPTVETKIILEDGSLGIASVPSGVSTGSYEAYELRDANPNRYYGMGVLKAVSNVNQIIAPQLLGYESFRQSEIDHLMISLDNTQNKKNLGGNAILSVSLAVCKASAKSQKLPLWKYINQMSNVKCQMSNVRIPTPTFNIINGGKHGAGNLDFQEFHIIPSQTKPYHQALQIGEEIYQTLKKVLIRRHAIHSVGDEGGFAPNLFTNLDALEVIMEAVSFTPYKLGSDVFLGLDVAASHFLKDGFYIIKDRSQPLGTDEMIEYYQDLNDQYHLLFLEDSLAEDDWQGWTKLTAKLASQIMIIGDDLLATHCQRLKKAIHEKSANAILVKPNQVGTLTETLDVVKIAKESDFKIIISHRAGETNDSFIADFAVAVAADYVKFGAPARGERIAKYNRLLEIENEI